MDSDTKPSLFAFQDIITSVIGIFIFISILLVLSISVETAQLIGELEEGSEFEQMNLKDDIKQLSSVNAALKKQKEALEERKALYDETLKKTEAINEQIANIEQEIEALSSMKISKADPTFMNKHVKEGQKRVQSENARIMAEIKKAQQLMSNLNIDNQELSDELAKYKNGVAFINKKSTLGSKDVIFIDANALGFKVIGAKSSIMSLAELEIYLTSLDKDKSYVQFLFRPSASVQYLLASKLCTTLTLKYGSSVVLEEEYILNE